MHLGRPDMPVRKEKVESSATASLSAHILATLADRVGLARSRMQASSPELYESSTSQSYSVVFKSQSRAHQRHRQTFAPVRSSAREELPLVADMADTANKVRHK